MTHAYSPRGSGLYRSRNGILFGVCRGIADYFDLSLFWLRVIVLAAFILTGFFPVALAYILAALLMKRKPA
ncbi:MAG: PspC domain-containing protein [Candidatus Hydrogenedentales bacterium]|jgi:phage shock protein C